MSEKKLTREAELLKNWFKSQTKWKTLVSFASSIGIPYSSLKKYFYSRPVKMREHRQKLYNITGIEAFRTYKEPIQKQPSIVPSAEAIKKVRHPVTKIVIDAQTKRQLAIDLRMWFQNQSKWKTYDDMAKDIGINIKTLGNYFQGRYFPTGENLVKLRETINLPILSQSFGGGPKVGVKIKPKEEIRVKEVTPVSRPQKLAQEKATIIKNILYSLNEELKFFKKGTADDRKIFKDTIPGKDVGYIIALLKALYDEDTFQNWLFFAEYEMGKE